MSKEFYDEMSELRDKFAGDALAHDNLTMSHNLMEEPAPEIDCKAEKEEYDKQMRLYYEWELRAKAKYAYKLADAMMEARGT